MQHECLPEFACTPCAPKQYAAVGGVGLRSRGDGLVRVGGKDLHPSHALMYIDSMDLFACTTCGCYASLMAASLSEECRPMTAKGKQTLRRLPGGKWTHPKGMPEAVQEALAWREGCRARARAASSAAAAAAASRPEGVSFSESGREGQDQQQQHSVRVE